MQSLDSQHKLRTGHYPDHPWCVEFYVKKGPNLEFVTELYYAKSQYSKVSSLIFPFNPDNNGKRMYIGGTIDMKDYASNFFKQNNLETKDNRILLLVTYKEKGVKTLFDPLSEDSVGSVRDPVAPNVEIPKFANSTFDNMDEKMVIQSIKQFDDSNNNNKIAPLISTNNGTFRVVATSSHDDTINLPINNKYHDTVWEWVFLKKIDNDPQITIKDLTEEFKLHLQIGLLIYPVVLSAIIGLVFAIMLNRRLKANGGFRGN